MPVCRHVAHIKTDKIIEGGTIKIFKKWIKKFNLFWKDKKI